MAHEYSAALICHAGIHRWSLNGWGAHDASVNSQTTVLCWMIAQSRTYRMVHCVTKNTSSDSCAGALISFLLQGAEWRSDPAYCMFSLHEVIFSHLRLQPDQSWVQYVVFKLGKKRVNKQKNAKVIATPSGPLVMIIWEIRILKSKYIHSCVYSVLQGQILHNSTLDFKS